MSAHITILICVVLMLFVSFSSVIGELQEGNCMTHEDLERGSGSGCLAWVLATAPGSGTAVENSG